MNLQNYRLLYCILFLLLNNYHIISAGKNISNNQLGLMGYSVIPYPREINLTGEEIVFDSNWSIGLENLYENNFAAETLERYLYNWHGLKISESDGIQLLISLSVNKGSVDTGTKEEINSQGYSLSISSSEINISGNSEQGLFYGVQTLIQLIKNNPQGKFTLPMGTINDWPGGQLRFLHWDTKNHQDRIETLKRYLDWSARFKINMISFELADKFAYPSHPTIGAPGAFTKEELQEIVDYGLERYIQVVPMIQAPAHMNYVLKHPEFAHLRTNCELCGDEGLNYQVCLCDERSYDLIFDMYQDVMNATKGVDYFFVSTDEIYYAGICEKCDPPYLWEDLSDYSMKSRSLSWVKFAKRAHSFIEKNNRTMLAWVEFPLLIEDVHKLPASIVDCIQRGREFNDSKKHVEAQISAGMKGLVYTSFQGGEHLIPNYFTKYIESSDDGSLDVNIVKGRLQSGFETLSYPDPDWNSENYPLGVFGATWDDSGLHNETFWLGWSTLAQYGWSPGNPSIEQHVSDFMNIYYGPNVLAMNDIYRGLREQADFFKKSWNVINAPELRLLHGGNHLKIWQTPRTRTKWTLPQPALPELFVAYKDVLVKPVYIENYQELVIEAKQMMHKNQLLREKINKNFRLTDRNHYNLEVLLSLAEFTRHHNQLIISMYEIEKKLLLASQTNDPDEVFLNLTSAHNMADEIINDMNEMFSNFQYTWEKSRFPKGRSLNGKNYFHVLDDVKEHWAYQQPDLSFYIAPELSIGLEDWKEELQKIINNYAEKKNIHTQ
jgi:hexosaminidase